MSQKIKCNSKSRPLLNLLFYLSYRFGTNKELLIKLFITLKLLLLQLLCHQVYLTCMFEVDAVMPSYKMVKHNFPLKNV